MKSNTATLPRTPRAGTQPEHSFWLARSLYFRSNSRRRQWPDAGEQCQGMLHFTSKELEEAGIWPGNRPKVIPTVFRLLIPPCPIPIITALVGALSNHHEKIAAESIGRIGDPLAMRLRCDLRGHAATTRVFRSCNGPHSRPGCVSRLPV